MHIYPLKSHIDTRSYLLIYPSKCEMCMHLPNSCILTFTHMTRPIQHFFQLGILACNPSNRLYFLCTPPKVKSACISLEDLCICMKTSWFFFHNKPCTSWLIFSSKIFAYIPFNMSYFPTYPTKVNCAYTSPHVTLPICNLYMTIRNLKFEK